RGIPEIDVTFDIDVNGILNVTAHEKTGGNKKSIVINAKTNQLSNEEINRMIKVAELFSDEDKLVKQRIEAKNDLESYTYLLRNQLINQKGYFQELSPKETSTIKNAVDNQIKWIDSNINAKTDEFKKQKKKLETIVLQIMSTIHGYKSNYNRTEYHGEL
ncbi:unnamed protein product, partial [Rotaria magnacalcarata]